MVDVDQRCWTFAVRAPTIIGWIAAAAAAVSLAIVGIAEEDDSVAQSEGGANRSVSLQHRLRALQPGERLVLTSVRGTTGHRVSLGVIEGTFSPSGISAPEQWISAGWRQALVVNSVDQQQSNSPGLSGAINLGCGIHPSSDVLLDRGGAQIHECVADSPYRKYGITRTANVAVITWKAVSENEPCFDMSRDSQRNQAEECVESSVREGLRNVLGAINRLERESKPDAIVLPALGTGFGGLPKARFYRVAGEVVLSELSSPSGYLPPSIYFHVWHEGQHEMQPSTSFALSSMVVRLEDELLRQRPRAKRSALWVIAGCCSALFFASAVGHRRPSGTRELGGVGAELLYVLGWLLTGFGVAMGFKGGLESLFPYSYLGDASGALFMFGFVGVLVARLLLDANDSFKATYKSASRET